MRRHFGLGLRAQILTVLGVVFLVSFPLLGLAAVQLAQSARTADRLRDVQVTARALARAIEASQEEIGPLADTVLGDVIAGIEIEHPSRGSIRRGRVGSGHAVTEPIESGGNLRVWVLRPGAGSGRPLARLLVFYVSITAGAVLFLVYIALTYLIVRPVEVLTRASERLARRGSHVPVVVRGAAEVSRLAVAFNEMSIQLRSERVALEERLGELERTTRELEAAQEKLVRSARLASVGRLSAGLAHEIGNPLSAIVGLLELVRAGGLEPDEREEFLSRIQAETERIHNVLRDLLDFARQGHETDEEGATADLREVVEDAVALVAPQKDMQKVVIDRRFVDELPHVRGSADRLTQLVLNLLLNAADAIEGEGEIRIEVTPINGGQVVLVVEDSGPGIASDVLEHLFEPFVTTKPVGQGTGLGLAVSHALVERLGGRIRAENPPGGGARIEVLLPAADQEDPAVSRIARA